MSTIADTIRRLEDAVERRPGFGSGTSRSRTTLGDGVRCVSVEGDWTIATDLPVALGGSSSAPTPSVLLRAALGACMAMSYRLRAERAGLGPFKVTVDVEADSQLAGMLLASSAARPGFTCIRYHVEVRCDAPQEQIRRVLDEGDRLSPVLDAIGRSTAVTRSMTIRPVSG
jgi:uncharacterized OsmC-like protein